LANEVLLLDGEVVTDLDKPAPPGTRITIATPAHTRAAVRARRWRATA
jgi:hypothetical protein